MNPLRISPQLHFPKPLELIAIGGHVYERARAVLECQCRLVKNLPETPLRFVFHPLDKCPRSSHR